MNHQSKNNQNQQKRSLAQHLAKHEAEKRKKWAGETTDTSAQNQSSMDQKRNDAKIGCLGCLSFALIPLLASLSPFYFNVFELLYNAIGGLLLPFPLLFPSFGY